MTFPKPRLRAAAIAGVAALTTALTFGASLAPTTAQAAGAYYRATLEQPVEKRTEIIRGGTFICSGTTCVGTKARSRPTVVCEKLASEFGQVATFSVGGTELSAEDLAACRATLAD
ncbi:CC_3452 family protein [Alteriqipengyuania sp. 357]